MAKFLKTICTTCRACQNLITLDPGPEQCNGCETTQNATKRSMKINDSVASPPSPKRDRPSQSTVDINETPAPASSNGTSELKE